MSQCLDYVLSQCVELELLDSKNYAVSLHEATPTTDSNNPCQLILRAACLAKRGFLVSRPFSADKEVPVDDGS